jgi:flagella basal body P-ring formation protein FlgA
MVGAWVLIEQSKTTEVFLVTKQNLASGTSLTASDLDQIPLSMFEISGSYLQPDALVEGLVLTRPLAAGEAVPVSALTTAELTNWSNVVLTPALELSSQIEVGTKVSI